MAAGQQLGPLMLLQQRQRFVNRCGAVVIKPGWIHYASPPLSLPLLWPLPADCMAL
jgi:hypothetical protein